MAQVSVKHMLRITATDTLNVVTTISTLLLYMDLVRMIYWTLTYCMDVYHIYVTAGVGIYVTSVEFKMNVVRLHEMRGAPLCPFLKCKYGECFPWVTQFNHLLGMAKIYPTNVWQTILHYTESV